LAVWLKILIRIDIHDFDLDFNTFTAAKQSMTIRHNELVIKKDHSPTEIVTTQRKVREIRRFFPAPLARIAMWRYPAVTLHTSSAG
jgi:hypothetical protein